MPQTSQAMTNTSTISQAGAMAIIGPGWPSTELMLRSHMVYTSYKKEQRMMKNNI